MTEKIMGTVAYIDLDALRFNYNEIEKTLPDGCALCPAVKANAYGHGLMRITEELADLGAKWVCVSSVKEALSVRGFGFAGDVLILGYTPPEAAFALSQFNLVQCVYSTEYAGELAAFARDSGVKVRCHIKIDTGMGRIGFACRRPSDIKAAADEIEKLFDLRELRFDGIFTHFPAANEDNAEFTLGQYNRFAALINHLSLRGIEFAMRHCSASAAILNFPDFVMNMVRPGICLYGLHPSSDLQIAKNCDLRPVMQLKSPIIQLKELTAGDSVSYDRTYIVKSKTKVATVPLGYGDGFPRSLSNKGYALVNGCKAPIIGRICMDQLMLDVTSVKDVAVADVAVFFGESLGERICVEEAAAAAGTINYELITGVSERVRRIFLGGSQAK